MLRISDISEFDKKKSEYEKIQTLGALGIEAASKALDLGMCNGGKSAYTLLTWIEGEDLADKLTAFNAKEQYDLGINAGEILRKIHTLPAPKDAVSWHENFNKRLDAKIRRIQDCDIKSKHEKRIIDFVNSNRMLLNDRPQCFQHGDFHVGNLIITPCNKLGIIDFNKAGYGDPYEEFSSIIWDVRASLHFARGKIDGYFCESVPNDFFPLLAFYTSIHTLGFLPWTAKLITEFGGSEALYSENIDLVMEWFDNLKTVIPNWYKE